MATTILVRDVLDTDTRPAGWWNSADGQGVIDMTGSTLAEAKRELLSQCGEDGDGEKILAGRLEILSDSDTTTTDTLTISLHSDSATAVLRRDKDGRWRWFDTTEDVSGVDMEISGRTAVDAMEALIAAHGSASIDGDPSDHLEVARTLDSEDGDVAAGPDLDFDPDEIIAEEGMDFESVGPVACLTITDDGDLADDQAWEPADLSSADAFRAQVRRWKADMA